MTKQTKRNLTAEEMLALENSEQGLAARREYDARHGQHDDLREARALVTPAPGAALAALRPGPTTIQCGSVTFILPPVKAAHFVLLQELDLPFYRKAYVDRETPLKFRDIGDTIFFFSQTPSQIERLISEGGLALLRRRAFDEVLDRVAPYDLVRLENALMDHLAAGNSTRLEVVSAGEGSDEVENPTLASPLPTASAGSSNSSPASPASSTARPALTTS